MSQRYFITAESTYESLRERLDAQLGYPNSFGKSVVQTPLHAPRDSYRRVLLAVDDGIAGYTTIIAAIVPLLVNEAMEELDEATYLAAVASASESGGVSSWNDLTDKPATFAPSAHKSSHATGGPDALTASDIGAAAESHTHTASQISDFTAAVVAAAPPTVDASLLTTGTLSASRLPSTTVTPGSYGSASAVATYTVDATGRLTAAGSTAIAIAAGAVSGLASVATSGSASDLGSGTVPVARLPLATTGAAGSVIVGTGLAVSSGTVSVSYGTASGTACQGNDARLSDSRTPTGAAGGDLTGTYPNPTIANAAVTVAKLSATGTASATTFLRGDGAWATAGSNSASDLTTGTLAAARIGAHASSHQTGGDDAVTNVVVSPSQITGNQNDYSPGTGDIVRLSSDAARNITGITAGSSGDVRVLVNVGSFTITLVHQSTSSTAANRFLVSFGADYLLAANAAAVIIYDGTTSRWRVI